MRRLKQKEALLAEVNDKGEVTVEGEFVGRLEGFRFRRTKARGQEAKRLAAPGRLQALRRNFHLRADRFYNAPDTEIDFTEQGGLMWGEYAVGKLVPGHEPLKPQVEVFVDDEAGPDVAEKVERRLQHFIDRKIAALFEPLMAMRGRDADRPGRGFAFRMVEALGVMPARDVADEVKALDQDARGAAAQAWHAFWSVHDLHAAAAETRADAAASGAVGAGARGGRISRSAAAGPGDRPPIDEAPAGLLHDGGLPRGGRAGDPHRHAGTSGRHAARRGQRGGFEAKADMLSITGMTLEQFADLMQGLGYKAERGRAREGQGRGRR